MKMIRPLMTVFVVLTVLSMPFVSGGTAAGVVGHDPTPTCTWVWIGDCTSGTWFEKGGKDTCCPPGWIATPPAQRGPYNLFEEDTDCVAAPASMALVGSVLAPVRCGRAGSFINDPAVVIDGLPQPMPSVRLPD